MRYLEQDIPLLWRKISNVIFLGGAQSVKNKEEWKHTLQLVQGKIFNFYSSWDMLLLSAYTIPKFSKPIGRNVLFEDEEDVDVVNIDANCYHSDYDENFGKLFQ